MIVFSKNTSKLRRFATMGKNNVIELAGRDEIVDPLTDLLRAGGSYPVKPHDEAKAFHSFQEAQKFYTTHKGG